MVNKKRRAYRIRWWYLSVSSFLGVMALYGGIMALRNGQVIGQLLAIFGGFVLITAWGYETDRKYHWFKNAIKE